MRRPRAPGAHRPTSPRSSHVRPVLRPARPADRSGPVHRRGHLRPDPAAGGAGVDPDSRRLQLPEFFALERERVFATSWVAVGWRRCRRAGPVCRRRGRRPFDHRHPQQRRRAARLPQRVPPPGHEAARRRRQGGGAPQPDPLPVPQLDLRHRRQLPGHPAVRGLRHPARPGSRVRHVARGFDRADYGLLPVAVDSWGFLVFVNLAPDPEPLPPQLGDLPQRFADYRLERGRPSDAAPTRSRRTTSSSARTSWSTTTCPGCIPS